MSTTIHPTTSDFTSDQRRELGVKYASLTRGQKPQSTDEAEELSGFPV